MRKHAPWGQTPKFTPAAWARLQRHTWPGNVRELRNVVRRALFERKGPKVDTGDISFEEAYHRAPEVRNLESLELPAGVTLEPMMARLERQFIESALRRCQYHKERTAKELGLARSSLFKRLKQ
ncbi:helix-turn-helix domain-containing protein [Hyalangium minutum]|uniref:Response regulator of zinc sigma-54-dependent two-component system n=1 Tax=Hyalangium minutum TaxID=394096 RepID=A0A085W7U7_9BACT|nr:helix-turn-helix domain-containing protein [Hyalangium minutum]KFE63760.1 Response regulator of zinc sigma-54-dependent two-component system [Hyalangium minutum]